jgi:drug/metabolite transporter (DMT)-like permease
VSTVFQKMSLLAPALVAILLYGESSSLVKWSGILCAIVAIMVMSFPSQTFEEKQTHKSSQALLLPILTFLGSCLIDVGFYLIDKTGLAPDGDIKFLASLFLCAGSIGLVVILYRWIRHQQKVTLKNILGGILLGIPNFFSLYLILLSLQQGLDGSVVFPINNVGVLIGAAILGYLIFGERFDRNKAIGFVISILAIALIALG